MWYREYVLLDTFVMLQEGQYQGSLESPSLVNSDEDIPIQSLWIHELHSSQHLSCMHRHIYHMDILVAWARIRVEATNEKEGEFMLIFL